MLKPSTLKLLAFELAQDLNLSFYEEAQHLLDAYLLMQHYHIPVQRLEEFQDPHSKKLWQFSQKFSSFLEASHLSLAPLSKKEKTGPALRKTPLGLFLNQLLNLKLEGGLEKISAVFTSAFIEKDLARRHYVDTLLRKKLHSYVDLKQFSADLEAFKAWQDFSGLEVNQARPLKAWVEVLKHLIQSLNILIPPHFNEALEAYFEEADAYLAPLSYETFLKHFNLFLENEEGDIEDSEAYKAEEASTPFSFIPFRLRQEYGVDLSLLLPQSWSSSDSKIALLGSVQGEVQAATQPYVLNETLIRLQNPSVLRLQEQIGGAALLNEQVACPFKAFGHFQLRARSLDVDEAWISHRFKGIAIHLILERLWKELKTQEALLALSDEELKKRVQETVASSVWALHQEARFFLPHSLAQLEISRLSKLILSWMHLEKTRPFFKVRAQEEQCVVYVGPLVLKLRLDRVDELEKGECIVIDYKTGAVNIKNWCSEPVQDFQLPLYVVMHNLSGALFAEVNGQAQYSGLLKEDLESFSKGAYPKAYCDKSWEEMLDFWRQQIAMVVQAISQGIAHVTPLPRACEHCDLHALCRIKEVEAHIDAD